MSFSEELPIVSSDYIDIRANQIASSNNNEKT